MSQAFNLTGIASCIGPGNVEVLKSSAYNMLSVSANRAARLCVAWRVVDDKKDADDEDTEADEAYEAAEDDERATKTMWTTRR